MDERRKYPRIPEILEVSHQQITDFFWGSGRSNDLSEAGIRLFVFYSYNPGLVLQLKIHLHDFKGPIECSGAIVWVTRANDKNYTYEVGVKFLEISPSDRRRIFDYIRSKKER